VYDFVKTVFTDKNKAFLAANHASYKAIGAEAGLYSIATPLHPGARKYWTEQKNPRVNEIPQ
ncbi:MAG: TAXI family TRAP transporter solute-binding subunit, partial [Rhodospirillales bacterium]